MSAEAPKTSAPGQSKMVPLYCNQCVCGPDLFKVEVKDGVALRMTPNFDLDGVHPAGGRICVKAYGLVQKTYNPNRITRPLKRTNPKKGKEHDPGFVEISWDEALGIVAAKLNDIQAKGMRDEEGYPRLAASFGGGGTPTRYMGTFPAFLSAWGVLDQGYGSGQGAKCFHSEHLYGEFWHRAFTVVVDSPNCDYIINFGSNNEASGGVSGVWRQADARSRGLKRVQVEPHLSVTGALSGEWVPIKPKTDPAFMYALIHRIVLERNWREICDVKFLTETTNSPYLVGPHGYFLRDTASGKPLIWDLADAKAKPYDDAIADAAMEGRYTVAGYEEGPDGERWVHASVEAQPSFELMREHIRQYTPEWAAAECDVPVETIRRVADEFVAHAKIGATITIEGVTLPHRPVGVMLGKGVNNGWGGYQAMWGRTMLACLVGALEVPGGTMGTKVRLNRPADTPEERQARRGRVHDLPVQLHQEGRVAVEAPHPQRLQDAGAAGGELAMVGGAGSRAPAVAVPAQGAQALAAPDAAGNVDLLPHQPGDLVLERARGCQAHRRIPVHACVRLHAGRVQLDGRRDPAGSHRP